MGFLKKLEKKVKKTVKKVGKAAKKVVKKVGKVADVGNFMLPGTKGSKVFSKVAEAGLPIATGAATGGFFSGFGAPGAGLFGNLQSVLGGVQDVAGSVANFADLFDSQPPPPPSSAIAGELPTFGVPRPAPFETPIGPDLPPSMSEPSKSNLMPIVLIGAAVVVGGYLLTRKR